VTRLDAAIEYRRCEVDMGLETLAHEARWVAWRNELHRGKPTVDGGRPGEDPPSSWTLTAERILSARAVRHAAWQRQRGATSARRQPDQQAAAAKPLRPVVDDRTDHFWPDYKGART
jgi:hypothetical protein